MATNLQSRKAKDLFKRLEGVDIHAASSVAVASLIKAVADGKVEKDATIMLNITGGGEELFKSKKEIWMLKPSIIFPLNVEAEEVVERCEELFDPLS